MTRPEIELSECIMCGICVDVAPTVFRFSESDYVEVVELDVYPEDEVSEAVKNCPKDCITRE